MHLSPQERDKLLIHVAADVARKRLERGVLLNYPEAVALITDHVLEGARDGRTVCELVASGRSVLSRAQVLGGVPEMVDSVQVEAIALPGPHGERSVSEVDVLVEGGGSLEYLPEPTVVTARERHSAVFEASLAADACLRTREVLVLGRAGERPGSLVTTQHVTRGEVSVLRQTLEIGDSIWTPVSRIWPDAGCWRPIWSSAARRFPKRPGSGGHGHRWPPGGHSRRPWPRTP